MNESELALMRSIHAKDGIAGTKETYDHAGLPDGIGDAAKQKVLKLGLITASKIALKAVPAVR